jgi:hypothetical protein
MEERRLGFAGPSDDARTLRPPNGQRFIAVTSRQLSGPHGKLMQMPGEAGDEEPETYPIIIRSYEPVADLDDRLQRIFAVLSLPPLEDLNAHGPSVTRSATPLTRDVAEPPLGMGFGDRSRDSEGESGVSEAGEA